MIEAFSDLTANEPSRYERILAAHAKSAGGLARLLADAAGHVRRNVKTSDGRHSILRQIAAGVIAPLQVAFVLWVLRRTRQEGFDRLYFLSRDGQVLLRIAEQLAEAYAIECELRYLHASRQAYNRATFKGESYGGWLWTNINEYTSIRDLLDRIGITPEHIREHLLRFDFDEEAWSEPVAARESVKVRAALEDEYVQNLVGALCQEKRTVLLRYLEQEKVLDGSNIGCVDIGWNGTVHSAISSLLKDVTGTSIHGLFFGLTKDDNSWKTMREAYFFDLNRNTGYINLTPSAWGPGDKMIVLLETFCAADHGSVSDFTQDGSSIQPVLRQGWRQTIIDWGLPVVRECIKAFTEYLCERLHGSDPDADIRPAVAGVLTEFWTNPTHAEADVWGSFPLEIGQGQECHLSKLAEPYDWPYLFDVMCSGLTNPRMDHHWRAGSLRLTGPLTRSMMRLLFGLHDRIKSLARR